MIAFAALGKNAAVHLAASELAAWVYSIISPLVAQVIVSHPRSMARKIHATLRAMWTKMKPLDDSGG